MQVPQQTDFSGPDPIDELERAMSRKRYSCYQAIASIYKSGKRRIKLPGCLTSLIRLKFKSPTGNFLICIMLCERCVVVADTYVGFKPKSENWRVSARHGRAVVSDTEPEDE